MKLAVNGWRLRTRTGVGRVLLNVIHYWTEEFVDGRFDEITLYSPIPVDGGLPIPSFVRQRVVGPDMRMLLWENLVLPWTVRDDVLLCPSYTRPLVTAAKTVSLMYEATSKLFPQYYPFQARFIQTPLHGWSARHSTRVVTNTEQAKEDIVLAYRAPPERVSVVPLAPAEVFHENYTPERLREVRVKYAGADVPYFLYVGKLTARRNVPRLVEALAAMIRLKDTPHRLVIVGLNTTNIDLEEVSRKLGVEAQVKHYAYVADDDLAPLYSAAEAFVLPYSYESAHALTLLEAQAAGTPVITAGTVGLRQASGDAALFVLDLEASTLGLAMQRLADDAALRAELITRGRDNAAAYTWRRTSSAVLDVLREAALA